MVAPTIGVGRRGRSWGWGQCRVARGWSHLRSELGGGVEVGVGVRVGAEIGVEVGVGGGLGHGLRFGVGFGVVER